MADHFIPSKERLAIIAALKAKYLGSHTTRVTDGSGITPGSDGLPHQIPPHSSTQEIPSVAVRQATGESTRGQDGATVVDAANSNTIMDSVKGAITASLKPSLMYTSEEGTVLEEVLEGEIVPDNTQLPHTSLTNKHTAKELSLRARRRGRWFAVALRIEFDQACLNMSYLDKAKLVGLQELCGDDEEELIFNYTSILNDMEFVSTRKKALEAFELEMDVPTAVSIAKAAKLDPQFAIFRRRLRQMDAKQRGMGDQRDQFGQLMSFLHGEIDTIDGGNNEQAKQISGITGTDDEGEADESNVSEQEYSVSNGLE